MVAQSRQDSSTTPDALAIARLQQQVVSAVSSSAWVRQGNIAEVARLITEQVAKLLQIERVSVWLFNDRKDELVCEDLFLLSSGTHSSGAVLSQAAFSDEFAYLADTKCVDASDPYTDPRTRGYVEGYLRPNQITSMLDAVVRMGEELVGLVCFEHVNQSHTWRTDEVVFSSQLGDQVALAVSIKRALDITEALRQRDMQLRELNEELEARVMERTASLHSANEALLQSERLAALGSIVAGVAHELNTPIGNARIVATTLVDSAHEFGIRVESGPLQKSVLTDFIQKQQHGAALLDKSLEKAASLIASFKSVSVDQSSGARRPFLIESVINDILEMLSPTLNKSSCRIEIRKSISPGLLMDSYPGALGQVLTNLVNNTLLHAFENRPQGTINISAHSTHPGQLELAVEDDGCGIAQSQLAQVFNPFYTTKLGKGGSGLGLHLVYNLVTQTLGGHIRVSSKPGSGACFHLQLPIAAPEQPTP